MPQITRTTFGFLETIRENNNREWFQANRVQYEASQAEVANFASEVLGLLNQFDVIETVSGKKSLYRIYRDVRFSKDKVPYKDHWGGYFRRAGKTRRGGLYFCISPGNSYISGGFFSPNKEDLFHIRQQIELDATPLRETLTSDTALQYFGELQGEQLKTAPKGFDKEHSDIDLLRYKQLYLTHQFTDQEALSADFALKMADGFRKMMPYLEAMTQYLTTDLNGEDLV